MAKDSVLKSSVVLSTALSIITVFVVVSYALAIQSELATVKNHLSAIDAQIEVLAEGAEHGGEGGMEGMMALEPTVEFTLKTWSKNDIEFTFIGASGSIEGKSNPMLMVEHDDVVKITVVNDDGVEHDLKIEGVDVHSKHVEEKGESASIVFKIEGEGEIKYYCSVPGHREGGMEGTIMVG